MTTENQTPNENNQPPASGSDGQQGSGGGPNDEESLLPELTNQNIEALTVKELRELCVLEQLPVSGNKSDLTRRLLLKKNGEPKRFAGAATKCRICGAEVSVTGTKTKQTKDGRRLVTRMIKCKGKHRHTYPLKEKIGADEK